MTLPDTPQQHLLRTMTLHSFIHLISATILLLSALEATATPLSDALEPLEKPDLASAKVVITSLDSLINRVSGNEKVVAERVRASIKNTFTAEFKVTTALKNAAETEKLAVQQEVNAADYLKPNKFGTVRDDEANRCLEKAKTLREDAASKVSDQRTALTAQLKELDTLANDFYIEKFATETIILHNVIEAIANRSLDDEPFTPSLNRRAIEQLTEFASSKDTWGAEAKNAEAAGNYDKAFELFTKVGDKEGRKRAAISLARELETAGFFGTAIEYYEKGGNYEIAKKLRIAHPELLATSFKKLDAEALYAHVSPSVVKIRTDNGHGSGFVFRRNGYILTNAHVVEGAKKIEVLIDNERTFPAVLKAIDEDHDLAVIRVETRDDLDYLSFARQEDVKNGTEIAALGYPLADLPTATIGTGTVSNTNRSRKGTNMVQIDVAVNSGNSGGPIVDQRGRVMGIVTWKIVKSGVERFNFAVSLDEIERFLKSELGEDFITR